MLGVIRSAARPRTIGSTAQYVQSITLLPDQRGAADLGDALAAGDAVHHHAHAIGRRGADRDDQQRVDEVDVLHDALAGLGSRAHGGELELAAVGAGRRVSGLLPFGRNSKAVANPIPADFDDTK